MMDTTESLSADEKAYFDSRGETAPPAETTAAEPVAEPVVETQEVDPETVDLDAEAQASIEKGAEDDKPKVHKVVPLPALTKERQKTKELSSKLTEAERKAAILEDRWNMLLQGQEQQPAKAEEAPQRPTDDPFALINYVADKLDAQEKSAAARTKADQEQQQLEQFRNEIAGLEDHFRATNTDYDDAVTFVAKSRDAELAMIYPLSTPEQRAQVIRNEWLGIANNAKQTRHNPAELIYNLAKSRGYVRAAPEPAKDPKAELEKLEAAVDGSTSLSEGGGGAPTTLSAQSIADMSPDAFAAWYAKDGNAQKFRRLAGG